jgi:orotidine-5'-phosphate decarboxylase
MYTTRNNIIVALDRMNKSSALKLAKILSGSVWGFKVNDLLLNEGVSIISELKNFGNVFADPKLHDIPNTITNSISHLEAAGADMVTLHASGGFSMLATAVRVKKNIKILAVTALTSLTDEETIAIYGKSASETVSLLTRVALLAKVDGIVCSPNELALLKKDISTHSFLKVVPGIRPSWHETFDDQARTSTPKTAIENGANYLVIGRPITESKDPKQALEKVELEIANC